MKLKSTGLYDFQSYILYLLFVSKVRTELGEKAFKTAAPFTWNELQND